MSHQMQYIMQEGSTNKLARGILSILVANIINVSFSIICNLVLPKFLSIDSYAQLKTYQLYASYCGLLHFGFVDGLYLEYGGKTIAQIEGKIGAQFSTLRFFQLCLTVVVTIIGVYIKNPIIIVFGLSILPANMLSCFKFFYQAVGEFSTYSRIINASTIVYFLLNMSLVFIFRTDNYVFYILTHVLIDVFLCVTLELFQAKKLKFTPVFFKFYSVEFADKIKNGILLTLGNFSSTLLTSMDRWFIKVLMTNYDFAQYAFAVSLENFLNVAISPVTVTMYNYLCTENDCKKIEHLRNKITIFAALLVSSAFPVAFILHYYLNKYISAKPVIFLLFSSQILFVTIKGVYVNLYKAQKKQNVYFTKLIVVIIVGFVFNWSIYSFYKVKESFAVGTLLTAVVWLILCAYDQREVPYAPKEIIYVLLEVVSLIILGLFTHPVVGFVAYIAISISLAYLFLKNDLSGLIGFIKSYLKRNSS